MAGKGAGYAGEIASRKAGGVTVVVTGDKILDANLAALPKKLHNKLIKGSLKRSGKTLLSEFRNIVSTEAYDTGAYMRATSVKQATKLKGKGIGVTLHVAPEKLKKIQQKKKGRTVDHYYPASLEFGYTARDGTKIPAVGAQRRALYDNATTYRDYFMSDLRQLVAEAGRA
jgi:hypothetical protein